MRSWAFVYTVFLLDYYIILGIKFTNNYIKLQVLFNKIS